MVPKWHQSRAKQSNAEQRRAINVERPQLWVPLAGERSEPHLVVVSSVGSRAKQSKAEQRRAKQSKAEQHRASQSKAEQHRAKQSKAEQLFFRLADNARSVSPVGGYGSNPQSRTARATVTRRAS